MLNPDSTVKRPVYAPNMCIHPKDYEASDCFSALEASFESRCREYIEKASLDMFNGNYMDNQIEACLQEAIQDIYRQRKDHVVTIHRILAKIHDGDRVMGRQKLEKFRREREACERELDRLKKAAYKGTCYDESNGGGR